jgi:hypothetical protein
MDDTATPRRQRRARKDRKSAPNDLAPALAAMSAAHAAPRAPFGKRKKADAAVTIPIAPPAPPPVPGAPPATAAPLAAASPVAQAPRAAELLPFGAGLATAAVLCFSFATALILVRASSPVEPEIASNASPVTADNPADTAGASQTLADVRIIGGPAEERLSCEDTAWPYIDKKCLAITSAEAAKNEPKIASKIGPKPIDARTPNPLADAREKPPIGSMTAIAPAHPRVEPTTDGLASQAPQQPADIAEPRAVASIDRTVDAVKPRRSVRVSERTERAASVERKRKRYRYADTRPHVSYRHVASERQETTTPFFFPFGLFSQAR